MGGGDEQTTGGLIPADEFPAGDEAPTTLWAEIGNRSNRVRRSNGYRSSPALRDGRRWPSASASLLWELALVAAMEW